MRTPLNSIPEFAYADFAPPASLRTYVRAISAYRTSAGALDEVMLDLELPSWELSTALRDSLGSLSETLHATFDLELREQNSTFSFKLMISTAGDIYSTVAKFYVRLG